WIALIQRWCSIPYEWLRSSVRSKDLGDRAFSDVHCFTPVQFVDVADPDVLRYLYAFNPIFRRVILDLYRVDTYHDLYDRAEDLFYSDEREGDDEDQARSFELAQLSPPPKTKPFALSYRHAAFLSQISPDADRVEWCIDRLRDTGLLTRAPNALERDRIARRLAQSRAWVEKQVPENRVKLLEQIPPEVKRQLQPGDHDALRMFATRAASLRWTEDAIKEAMVTLTKSGTLPVETNR